MISYNFKSFFLLFICTTFIAFFMLYYPNSSTQVHIKYLDKHLSDEEVVQVFKDWKKEHERVYKDNEEMTKFVIFKSNLKDIIEFNARRNSGSSHTLGLNKFSDWSDEEFKETYLNCVDTSTDGDMPIGNVIDELNELPLTTPPPTLDWRVKGVVTDVKNQWKCSCCWAFSTVGGIEGINAIVTKNLITLSAQELVDCDTVSCGCKSGTILKGLKWVIKNGGVASEVAYPFKGKDGICQASKVPNSATISSYVKVEKSNAALLSATAIQPISVGIDATGMKLYNKDSGVYYGNNCKNATYTNHAVLIVGYDRTKEGVDYWIVKNSWGKGWGKDGYIWIERNSKLPYGACGINTRAFRPIK